VLKVNGVNVMQSTHTDVVQLIKCKFYAVFTNNDIIYNDFFRF